MTTHVAALLCPVCVLLATTGLLVAAAVLSSEWAANTYDSDVERYNAYVAGWEAQRAEFAGWAPSAASTGGATPLASVVGQPNSPPAVFMPPGTSWESAAVAPAAYPVADNVWYNASAALFKPFTFRPAGTFARLNITTPRGGIDISVTTAYSIALQESCNSDGDECVCTFNGVVIPSCVAYFTLTSICLVLDAATGAPAVASETGGGCAVAPNAAVAYPNGNACLPPVVDGLSPFGYTLALYVPNTIDLGAVAIALRSAADPWVFAMHVTGGSANFGTDASRSYVLSISLWASFGVFLACLAGLAACMSPRACSLLSSARLEAWRVRLASRRLHPNIGRTFRHRGAGGGDVPHDALVDELLAAPPPRGVPPAVWAGAGAEQREVLVGDVLEGDPVWRARDRMPCLRLPLCAMRCCLCAYACLVAQRDGMRAIAAAFSLRLHYKWCTRAVLLFLGLATFILLLTLLLVWPLGDSFVCQWVPTCHGTLSSSTCASLAAIAELQPAVAVAYRLQLACLVAVVSALVIPVLLAGAAPWVPRLSVRACVAAGVILYALTVLLEVVTMVHYYLGGIDAAATSAFCDTDAAYASATCTVSVDMQLAMGLLTGLAVANTCVYTLALTAVPGVTRGTPRVAATAVVT